MDIGSFKRLLNLAHVVHFTVEDTRVSVRLTDPSLKIEPLDGDEAEPVINAINTVTLGRGYRFTQPPIPNLGINVDMAEDVSDDDDYVVKIGPRP